MRNQNFRTGAAIVATMATAMVFAQADPQDQGGPQGGITVTVDGRPLNFRGASAQMVNGRVLVPLRGIFERLGAYVQWNAGQREVVATRGHNNVELQIGNPQATVDGRQVTLDVPAQIVDGATMVPIRFVSESLGAEVKWREAQQMVVIFADRGRAERIVNTTIVTPSPAPWHGPARSAEVLDRNVVIPVVLDRTLSSVRSREGERFTATVRFSGAQNYGFLPAGTRISGVVTTAMAQRGDQPGMLELQFNQINLPDGSSYPIAGRLIGLNDGSVAQGEGGMLMARGESIQEARPVFAGVGPNGRTIVTWGSNVERRNPRNVNLEAGTEFGVRLLRQVTIQGRDLRR